ncbi:uncharacterized protein FIBRA_00151 [Fibroporia radiculosa]|uniref:Uncharacterized protein n=1 Tax=Fibroporia radiculosa TaxID=599839 RepID=J7RGH0_9APHY|nr:uncharacterized protein FIBRA_00151 [Fibroporia radiculosa]CCL98157.1 predicted protein [Fibroporia radiculosa]
MSDIRAFQAMGTCTVAAFAVSQCSLANMHVLAGYIRKAHVYANSYDIQCWLDFDNSEIYDVTTLSVGQFIIEYIDDPCITHHRLSDPEHAKEPLLSSPHHYDEPGSTPETYPPATVAPPPRRVRSKPHSIYIHPSESNIVRADVVAQELGLSDTNLSKSDLYPEDDNSWEPSRNRDVARGMWER